MAQRFCFNKCVWLSQLVILLDLYFSVICCQLPYWIEASRTPGLLLALADGNLELHHLKDSFSPNDSDVKQFEMYLDSLSRS